MGRIEYLVKLLIVLLPSDKSSEFSSECANKSAAEWSGQLLDCTFLYFEKFLSTFIDVIGTN